MIKEAIKDFNASDYNPATVIGEFSGRDSVAAIMKAFEDPSVQYILPVATFAGTEYGDFDVLFENYKKMVEIVKARYGDQKTIYPLIEYSNKDIWALMNGRMIALNANEHGYMTPCIGCHLYFHLTKLPFALALSGRIISGERASHDGRIKVNQLDDSLDSYQDVIKACGGELLMPIRDISNGEEIESLIGWEWEEGQDHPKCVLSGNYRDEAGKAIYDEEELKSYLKEGLIPLGRMIGQRLTTTDIDIEVLKREVFKSL